MSLSVWHGPLLTGGALSAGGAPQVIEPQAVASTAALGSPALQSTYALAVAAIEPSAALGEAAAWLTVSATLRPNGDGPIPGDWTTTGANYWGEIDDDPDTPDDGDYIVGASGSGFFDLTDTPDGFLEMVAAQIKIRLRGDGASGGSPISLYARAFAADDTTPLSQEVLCATKVDDDWTTATAELTGLAAGDKSTWDGARLRLRVAAG